MPESRGRTRFSGARTVCAPLSAAVGVRVSARVWQEIALPVSVARTA